MGDLADRLHGQGCEVSCPPVVPFGILGPLVVAGASPRGASQQARLLGLLLAEHDRIVPTCELARWALGDERAHDSAQVQVLVARVRRQLRERALPGAIETATAGYCMSIQVGSLDAVRFEKLIRRSSVADRGDPFARRRMLEDALRLWRGDVLAGLGLCEHPAALRLEELRAEALESAFALDVEFNWGGALPELLESCRRYPGRERLHIIGMAALFLASRQAEALALYQRARRHLAGELGVEPGVELQAAHSALLRHERDVLVRLASGRDHTGSDSALIHKFATPRPAARDVSTGSVAPKQPRFSNSFVGRASQVATVRAMTCDPRLLTLVGPGGIGKTRLACESLRSWIDDCARPLWFCDLAAMGDTDEVTRLVAATVGARIEPAQDSFDALVAALRDTAGVLVLDSCETRLADVASLVARLRIACPDLSLLATSRQALGLEDEVIQHVPPLDVDTEALELFYHRAIDRDPEFAVDVDGLDDLRALCQRLDGLPLAIELAAARIRTTGPAELLHHLDQQFALLHCHDASNAPRHRSLEATIAWSYSLLEGSQRALLRRLSIFAGSVGLEDLIAVCTKAELGTDSLLRALGELVDRSMVTTIRVAGTTRYRLLDTIRAFARQRAAEAAELPSLHRWHADHYATLTGILLEDLRSAAEDTAVKRLDEIWPEVRAAVGRSLQAGDVHSAVRLVAGLGFEAVFRERGEVVDWADRALTLPRVLEHPRADELLGTAALADWAYGHFDRGLLRAAQAVALHTERGTRISPDVAAALPLHVSLRGDIERTITLLRAHRDEAERADVPFARIHMLICEAMAFGFAGQSSEADSAMDQAEDLSAQLGCRLLQAIAAFTRTIVTLDRRPEEAVGHARRALHLAETIRATWFLSAGSNYLVAALARTSDPATAVEPLRISLARQLNGGTVQSAANSIRNAAVVLERLGSPEHAIPLIGWLEVNRPSIPGTPAMRSHAQLLAAHLRSTVGEAAFGTGSATGATFSLTEAVQAALTEIDAATARNAPGIHRPRLDAQATCTPSVE